MIELIDGETYSIPDSAFSASTERNGMNGKMYAKCSRIVNLPEGCGYTVWRPADAETEPWIQVCTQSS